MNIRIDVVHEGVTYEHTAITGYGEQANYFFDLIEGWIKITDETVVSIYNGEELLYKKG